MSTLPRPLSLFPFQQNDPLTNFNQGGWAEHLLTHPDVHSVFDKYLSKCKNLGFVSSTHTRYPIHTRN